MTSLNAPLAFERAIRERVASGVYPSAEVVFATCLEALDQFEKDKEIRWRAPRADDEDAADRCCAAEAERMELLYAHLNTRRIARRLARGCYISVGDVINSALMAYDELDAVDADDHVLRAEIEESIASVERGEGIPADEVIARIQEELRKLSEARERDP
jgi:Arc/MetJ-type ribon-helix-helix transcriptional regulator